MEDYINKNWYNTYIDLKKFIDTNNKLPSQINKDVNISKLGNWLSHQKYNYKNRCMKTPYIYSEWERFINDYKKYFIYTDEEWYINFNLLKGYVNKHNKLPSMRSNDINIKNLSKWVSCQKYYYKRKTRNMKNIDIYNEWEQFGNKYFKSNIDKWFDNYNKLVYYITTYYKLPSTSNNNITIKKLGKWYIKQKINYKYKLHIMNTPKIYNTWVQFIKEYNIN